MYDCPGCKSPTISGARKWWSNMAYAECSECQRLCHVPGSSANAIFALAFVMFVLTIVAMITVQSTLVGIPAVLVTAATYVALWHRADLIPVSRERVATERKVGIVAAIFSAIISIFN